MARSHQIPFRSATVTNETLAADQTIISPLPPYRSLFIASNTSCMRNTSICSLPVRTGIDYHITLIYLTRT